MKHSVCSIALFAALTASAQNPQSPGQIPLPRMVNPGIDRAGEPFSYPSESVDEIGAMFAPSAAELTPNSTLYTGFGELTFFTGIERLPFGNRIRTLEEGRLPIVHLRQERDGLRYEMIVFAAPLNDGSIVNFLRITASNPGTSRRRAFVTASWGYTGAQTTIFPTGDNRFRRPLTSARVGDFHQPGEDFHPQSRYEFLGNAILRDGKTMVLFPESPRPSLSASYRDYYNRTSSPGDPASPRSDTPMSTVEYAFDLQPGESRSLDFKVPLVPGTAAETAASGLVQASFDDRRSFVQRQWHEVFDRGMRLTVAEDKVNAVFDASLMYCLLALNNVDGQWIQTINQFQYHRFYLRDSADFVRMYDSTGYRDLAAKVLSFYPQRQMPDGNYLSQPGQYDAWGLAVWSMVEHFRMTQDHAYAEAIYPNIQRAVQWLEQAVAKDPMHLMPATDVRDNEYVPGHLTGYNFLALDGLDAAVRLAHDLHHPEDEARDRAVRDALRAAFFSRLNQVTANTDGYIPPALDGQPGGTDWGNLLSLLPEQQLPPHDPKVTATLQAVRRRYAEGLMTYTQPGQGVYLHHYLTIKNTLTELIRGEDEHAVQDLDAILVHTSSTNAGWEYSIRPWGNRDFSGNLTPHGWFSADYRNLLRNMMVREEGDTLHLFSAVSPAWIGKGKEIRVEHADTYFGRVSFSLRNTTDEDAEVSLNFEDSAMVRPRRICLHLPWFVDTASVVIDEQSVPIHDRSVTFPSTVRKAQIHWKIRAVSPDTPASYDDAVKRYKREYSRRFREATGE